MSIFFISDLHIGHKNIINFHGPERGNCKTVEEHDQWLIQQWNSRGLNKRDIIIILGDVLFDRDKAWVLGKMIGTKWVLPGNHDRFLVEMEPYVEKLIHFTKRYGYWLSHAPIHPLELRGKKNIHGHVHSKIIPDPRYISVCVEALNGIPISIDQIRKDNP